MLSVSSDDIDRKEPEHETDPLKRGRVWVHRCPRCGQYLTKKNLLEPLVCVCGWVW